MQTILCFGNPYLKQDNLAIKLGEELKKEFKVEFLTAPEQLTNYSDNIIILDVVKNIKEPIIITDISQLKSNNLTSLHDFDLTFFLKLMKQLNKEIKINIIGIPIKGDLTKLKEKIKSQIHSTSKK
jgi:Ni,Fe-hydrogenase maturation factor